MPPPHLPIAIDCFVRATALVDPVDATIKTLREYENRALIDEVTVGAWPDEIPVADDTEDAIVARYDIFQTWADKHGVSLEPAFTTRERSTLISDTAETVLVLPVVCLAIHIDGDVASVVPHHTETTTYTVEDALADLEALGRIPAPEPAVADERATQPAESTSGMRTPEQCPVCGDTLVTGQGLYACPTCAWSDISPIQPGTDSPTEAAATDEQSFDEDIADDQQARDTVENHAQPRS